MLRSFVKGIFILGFAFLAAACGSEGGSSSGGGGGGKSSQEELLGYNPSSRWPDQGSYRYTMRQGSCVTEQRFENQASYCLGLMNQKLNNGCALEGRRSAYERNCGSDFQQTDIRAIYVSGFDSRLQKNCNTFNASDRLFAVERLYCDFLRDESLHQQCHWDSRQQAFVDSNCLGNFSPAPAPVEEETEPTPPPQEPTPPSPPEDHRPAIVRELEAAGIKVEQGESLRDYGRSRPWEPRRRTLQQALSDFYSVLERNKSLIYRAQKEYGLQQISIQTFSSTIVLDSAEVHHSLNIDYDDQGLIEYFTLQARAMSLMRTTGVSFDLGIESFGRESDGSFHKAFIERLSALENQAKILRSLSGLIRFISTGSYGPYYSSGELELAENQFAAQLAQVLRQWAPLSGLAAMIREHKIDFEASAMSDKFSQLTQTLTQLSSQNLSQLNRWAQAGQLRRIKIEEYSSGAIYWARDRELGLPLDTANKATHQSLSALDLVFASQQTLKVPIEFGYDLNVEFVKLAELLSKNTAVINRHKKASLKQIRFFNRTDFSASTLYFGPDANEKLLIDLLAKSPK